MANSKNGSLNGYQLFCREQATADSNLKLMDFKTRNPLLSQRWKLLPEHEKLALNRRARNEKVLDNAELTKRLLKTIGCQFKKLQGLGVNYIFIAEVKGKMEVHGTDLGMNFAKMSNCASKFFAFLNSYKGHVDSVRVKAPEQRKGYVKQVRELVNKKFSEATAITGSKFSYTKFENGDLKYEVVGMPDLLKGLRDPSTMGNEDLQKIISAADQIRFRRIGNRFVGSSNGDGDERVNVGHGDTGSSNGDNGGLGIGGEGTNGGSDGDAGSGEIGDDGMDGSFGHAGCIGIGGVVNDGSNGGDGGLDIGGEGTNGSSDGDAGSGEIGGDGMDGSIGHAGCIGIGGVVNDETNGGDGGLDIGGEGTNGGSDGDAGSGKFGGDGIGGSIGDVGCVGIGGVVNDGSNGSGGEGTNGGSDAGGRGIGSDGINDGVGIGGEGSSGGGSGGDAGGSGGVSGGGGGDAGGSGCVSGGGGGGDAGGSGGDAGGSGGDAGGSDSGGKGVHGSNGDAGGIGIGGEVTGDSDGGEQINHGSSGVCGKKRKKGNGDMCDAYLCQEPYKEKTIKTFKWVFCNDCQEWQHLCCLGLTRTPKSKLFSCGCNKTFSFNDIKDKLEFSFNERRFCGVPQHLLKIRNHKIVSIRQRLFENRQARGSCKRLSLMASEFNALSNRQYKSRMKEVRGILKESWPDFDEYSLLTYNYVMEVMLIEALVYAFQIIFDCNRSVASRILADCANPLAEQDSDSD